jgi:hypothetical protein
VKVSGELPSPVENVDPQPRTAPLI